MYTFWNWEGGSESCFYCWVWKPLLSFDIFCCGFAIDFLILWLFRMWIWVCPCVGHAWRLQTTFGTFQFSFEAGSLLGPRTSSRPGWLVHARASRKPPVSAFHLTVSGITGRWDYMLSFCVGAELKCSYSWAKCYQLIHLLIAPTATNMQILDTCYHSTTESGCWRWARAPQF